MKRRHGMALITVLGVGACLIVLIAALLSLTVIDYRWEGRRQQRLQAYWDAPRNELAGVLRELVSEGKAREDQDRYFPPEEEGDDG